MLVQESNGKSIPLFGGISIESLQFSCSRAAYAVTQVVVAAAYTFSPFQHHGIGASVDQYTNLQL